MKNRKTDFQIFRLFLFNCCASKLLVKQSSQLHLNHLGASQLQLDHMGANPVKCNFMRCNVPFANEESDGAMLPMVLHCILHCYQCSLVLLHDQHQNWNMYYSVIYRL